MLTLAVDGALMLGVLLTNFAAIGNRNNAPYIDISGVKDSVGCIKVENVNSSCGNGNDW